MTHISGEKIRKYLGWGEDIIRNVALDTLNEAEENAFIDAVEIGIVNTVAALYDADVNDSEIVRLLMKYWEIDKAEAEIRLLNEKRLAPVRELKNYMKMQGFSKEAIDQFLKCNNVSIKVRHNNDLWGLRRKPEKLMKVVQGDKNV